MIHSCYHVSSATSYVIDPPLKCVGPVWLSMAVPVSVCLSLSLYLSVFVFLRLCLWFCNSVCPWLCVCVFHSLLVCVLVYESYESLMSLCESYIQRVTHFRGNISLLFL